MVLPALKIFRCQRQGTIDLGRAEGSGIVGQRGRHTDDFVRLAVNPHGFADDSGITCKVRQPVCVAQDNDLVSAGHVLGWQEFASKFHLQPQDAEVAGGSAERGEDFCRAILLG